MKINEFLQKQVSMGTLISVVLFAVAATTLIMDSRPITIAIHKMA